MPPLKSKLDFEFKKKIAEIEAQLQNQYRMALVACSGGADSVALTHLMKTHWHGSLSVIHIDHAQRKESAVDAKFVKKLCSKLNVPCKVVRLKVKKGLSEEQMRRLRYNSIFKYAKKINACVITGHNAQDQIETYLFKLIRGTHPSSLKGIPFMSCQRGVTLIRPLLFAWRDEIEKFLDEKSILRVQDKSNFDIKFARNAIRYKLLPLLNDLRPNSEKRILDFFILLEKIQTESKQKMLKILHSVNMTPLKLGHFAKTTEIRFEELREFINNTIGENLSKSTKKAHWEQLAKAIELRKSRKTGGGEKKVLQFPGGYSVEFIGDELRLVDS